MVYDSKIMRKGQGTPSGGIIHKGTNYFPTKDGLAAVASNNPKTLADMGISDPGSLNAEASFKGGFGFGAMGIGHEQLYSNPGGFGLFGKFDLRPDMKNFIDNQMVQMKALATTAGGAGTAGYAMIPVYVDPRVVDVTRKFTPLVEMIQRVANMGTTADYNQVTAKGAAAYKLEDAGLTDQNDTYDRKSQAIKYAYSVGRVTGPTQMAMPGYTLQGFTPSGTGLGGGSGFGGVGAPSANQIEVLMKTRALRELQENTIVNGDATANDYNGIINLMSTTNTVALGTTALKLSDIKTAIRYAFDDGGRPNLAVCSSSVYEDIENLLSDQLRANLPMTNLPWGVETMSLRGMTGTMPLIPSMFMSNTSGSKGIYFLDMTYWEMRTLLDVTYEKLAKTNDSDKFMLKAYEALICKNTGFSSSVTGIA